MVNTLEIFNIFFNKEDLNKNNRNFSFEGECQIINFHLLIVVNIKMEKKTPDIKNQINKTQKRY